METNKGLGANTNGLSEIIHPAHTKEQRVWLLAFDELNQSMSIGQPSNSKNQGEGARRSD